MLYHRNCDNIFRILKGNKGIYYCNATVSNVSSLSDCKTCLYLICRRSVGDLIFSSNSTTNSSCWQLWDVAISTYLLSATRSVGALVSVRMNNFFIVNTSKMKTVGIYPWQLTIHQWFLSLNVFVSIFTARLKIYVSA